MALDRSRRKRRRRSTRWSIKLVQDSCGRRWWWNCLHRCATSSYIISSLPSFVKLFPCLTDWSSKLRNLVCTEEEDDYCYYQNPYYWVVPSQSLFTPFSSAVPTSSPQRYLLRRKKANFLPQ